MKRPGFVFDLDDTLYKERDYVRSCLAFAAARLAGFGYDGGVAQLVRLHERGEQDPVGVICASLGVGDMEKRRLVEAMRAHEPEIALSPDAAAFLDDLRARQLTFSIVTNGRGVTQRRKIAALGLQDAAAIVISEELGAAKPDIRCFEAVAQMHGADRHLYVADNPEIDFIGPNRLGWLTVMLRNDGRNVRAGQEALSAAQRPSRTIDRLTELADYL